LKNLLVTDGKQLKKRNCELCARWKSYDETSDTYEPLLYAAQDNPILLRECLQNAADKDEILDATLSMAKKIPAEHMVIILNK
jgi:hypothetical protein